MTKANIFSVFNQFGLSVFANPAVPQKFQAQVIYFSYKDRSGPTKIERPADHLYS